MKLNRDGYGPDGRRLYFKGGGGGGGQTQRDATPEERALWSTQERISRETFNMGAPKYQQSIDALGTMASDAMDGTLATRARGIAGADAAAATGAGLSAATRSLDRYGATVNPNAMAATSVNAGLSGAALKSDAINKAGMWAEDQKWNRNQGLFNSVQGLPGQTTSSLASLSKQLGDDRQQTNASNASALAGIGQGAAYVASKFKDGGEVEKGYASGGFTPIENPFKGGMPSSNRKEDEIGTSDVIGAVAPAVATEVAARGLKAAGKAGMDALRKGMSQAPAPVVDAAPKAVLNSMGATEAGTEIGVNAADAGIGAGATEAGIGGGAAEVGTAATAAAETGAGALAAEGIGAEAAMAAAAAPEIAAAAPALGALGPIGLGLGAAFLLSEFFADGGEVGPGRIDVTQGGEVSGPGTATSDSVPARLSDGEVVENASAVALPKDDTISIINKWAKGGGDTKALLLDINQAGLKRRNSESGGIKVSGGEAHAADGGFWTNFGLAARGFVPTAMALDQQKAENTRHDRLEAENTRRFDLQEGRAAAAETSRVTAEKDAKAREDFTKNELGGIQTFGKMVELAGQKYKAGVPAAALAPYISQGYNAYVRDGVTSRVDDATGNVVLHNQEGNVLASMTPEEAVKMLASPETAQRMKQGAYERILANGRPDVAKALLDLDDKRIGRAQDLTIAREGNIAKAASVDSRDNNFLLGLMARGLGGAGGAGTGTGTRGAHGTGQTTEGGAKVASFDDFSKVHLTPEGKPDPEKAGSANLTYQQLLGSNKNLASTAQGEAAARFLASQYAEGKIQAVPEIGPDNRWGYYLAGNSGNKYLLDMPERGIDPGSLKGADGKPRMDPAAVTEAEQKFLKTVEARSPEHIKGVREVAMDPKGWANVVDYYNRAKAGKVQVSEAELGSLRSQVMLGEMIQRNTKPAKDGAAGSASGATAAPPVPYAKEDLAVAAKYGVKAADTTPVVDRIAKSYKDGWEGVKAAASDVAGSVRESSFSNALSGLKSQMASKSVQPGTAIALADLISGNPDLKTKLTADELSVIRAASGKPTL